MKKRLTQEMKEKIIVGIVIATFSLILYYLLTNFKVISNFMDTLTSILFPFIFGFALAFLLNPIMMFFEDKVFKNWKVKGKSKRLLSAMIALVIAIVTVAFLVMLIVPAIVDSVSDLLSHSEEYISTFSQYITKLFNDLNLDASMVDQLVEQIVGEGNEIIKNFGSFFSEAIPALISTSYGIIRTLLNLLIGIAAAVYMLLDKEMFIGMVNKANYAIFPQNIARYLKSLGMVIRDVFYDFIVGKAIDSFIIGILCYVGLLIMDIEYPILFSVIVGITNMIPVFGPFIGAIPGGIILLFINPIHSVTFLLFILALQQFDGNVLGPLILGDKLGMPSFFILLSVSLGGAFFGVLGMFIGVPTFAVLYYGISGFMEMRLSEKNIDMQEETKHM